MIQERSAGLSVFHSIQSYAVRALRVSVMGQRGNNFFFFFLFFAFLCHSLCVSEHFMSIETHLFFENFREREAQNACTRSEQDASVLEVLEVLELRSD